MIRSMFTAISALNLNQTFLDVISDNLANSNTTGFKASRVIFQDQFAQIMSSGAAPIGNVGGINPTEVGLGVKLGYVSPTFTQGMMQATGRSTDLAVQGNGFFVYTNGQETSYSREGSLEIDADGYLVNNSTGMRITGWMVPAGGSAANIDTNQPTRAMQISLDATVARATTIASLGGNLNSSLNIRAIEAPAILDATAIGTDYAASLSTPTTAHSELATGEYTIRTIISGNSTDGYTYAAQVLNKLGNPVGASINGTYDNAASNTIAFGNGLTITIDSGLAGDDAIAATIVPTTIGTGMTAVVGVVGGSSDELLTGTYSVDYTIAGDALAGFTYSAQMLDDAGDPFGLPVTGTYDPVGGSTMNFLNGLEVDLDPGLANGDVTGVQFVYTHSIPAEGTQTISSGSIEYTHSVTATDGASVESTIAVYDSLGDAHTPTFQFTRTTNPLVWNWRITSPLTANGSGTLTFTSDGLFNSATGTDSITIPGSVGAESIVLSQFDLSSLTMFSSDTTLSPRSQDGLAAGSVSELYGAPNTGEMYLVYSNGLKQLVGQLALAHFTNPSGLLRAGSNQYKIGLNSGEPQIGTANTGGRGAITSGYLEASNVDMAQEFTNMILAQRSFQASTRVITTSDEILQELVNLKR